MQIHIQFMRYGIIGLLSNGILYCLYLMLTWLGLEHKIAMSSLYVVGIMQTFIFNRQWTFEHKGLVKSSLARYVATYVIGYIFQLVSLLVFVDQLGFPHQLVMAILILVTAVSFFVLQKYWVFSKKPEIITE